MTTVGDLWEDIEKDRRLRDRVNMIVSEMQNFLSTMGPVLVQEKDGTIQVLASIMSKDPIVKYLRVVLVARGNSSGLGKRGDQDVMVLPFLSKDGSGKIQFDVNKARHELFHLMDPGRGYGTSAQAADRGMLGSYFNDAAEFHAYFQEGVGKLEDVLAGIRRLSGADRQRKGVVTMLGPGDWRTFRQKVTPFWDVDFVRLLNRSNAQKFDKKLAIIWKRWREEGIWDV